MSIPQIASRLRPIAHAATQVATLLLCVVLHAADRPVPPPGIPVPPTDRADLEAGLTRLTAAIDKLQAHLLAPDVIIFRDAVHYALKLIFYSATL